MSTAAGRRQLESSGKYSKVSADRPRQSVFRVTSTRRQQQLRISVTVHARVQRTTRANRRSSIDVTTWNRLQPYFPCSYGKSYSETLQLLPKRRSLEFFHESYLDHGRVDFDQYETRDEASSALDGKLERCFANVVC